MHSKQIKSIANERKHIFPYLSYKHSRILNKERIIGRSIAFGLFKSILYFFFSSLSSFFSISDWQRRQIYRVTSPEVGVLTAGALIPITIDCMRIMVSRDYRTTNLRTIPPLFIAIRFSPPPKRWRRRRRRDRGPQP